MLPIAQRGIKLVPEDEAMLQQSFGYDVRGQPQLLDSRPIHTSIDANFLQHFERQCGHVHKPDWTGNSRTFISRYLAERVAYLADCITLTVTEIVGDHASVLTRHKDQ